MQFKQFALAAGVVVLSAGSAAAAVVTNDLNLRSGPSTRYGVVDTMPAGAQVSILSCTGSWCRVSWRGEVGYASRNYLSGSGYAAIGSPEPFYTYDYGYPDYPDYYDYGYGPGFFFGTRAYHYRHHRRGRHIGRGDHHGGGHHVAGGRGGNVHRYVAGGSGGRGHSGSTVIRSRGTVGMGGGSSHGGRGGHHR
jgi:uncharacterized protein YraI